MAEVVVGVARMREQLFFEGRERGRKLSRFWLLLSLAAVIAAAGVVADSTATVIGAMIVAPLMVPILGCVVAVVLADRDNLLRCAVLVVAGAAAVVAIGFCLGLLLETPVVAANNSQVASRVSPRLIDLLAALATGAVGSIALARDDISDTLPGVAIAISLVPPLSVVGLTLESGAPSESLGALLLFTTNVSAILATGLAVMAIYRIHRLANADLAPERRALRRGRAVSAIVIGLAVIAIPLTVTSMQAIRTNSTQSTVQRVAADWADPADWDVVSVSIQPDGVRVRTTGPSPGPDPDDLRAQLSDAGLAGTTVDLEMIPASKTSIEVPG